MRGSHRDPRCRESIPDLAEETVKNDSKTGDPGMTRTCDLRFRKPSLYPAELRDRSLPPLRRELAASYQNERAAASPRTSSPQPACPLWITERRLIRRLPECVFRRPAPLPGQA